MQQYRTYSHNCAVISRISQILNDFCPNNRINRLIRAIREFRLTTAIEILESEGFYGDAALVVLAYLQVEGVA